MTLTLNLCGLTGKSFPSIGYASLTVDTERLHQVLHRDETARSIIALDSNTNRGLTWDLGEIAWLARAHIISQVENKRTYSGYGKRKLVYFRPPDCVNCRACTAEGVLPKGCPVRLRVCLRGWWVRPCLRR